MSALGPSTSRRLLGMPHAMWMSAGIATMLPLQAAHAAPTPTDPFADRQPGDLPPSNILLIIADDLGVDKVGSYARDVDPDYPEEASWLPDTPVLDDIATRGVRFTQAWANPSCAPTRAALLTGTHGFRTGIGSSNGGDDQPHLDPDTTTFAELLADQGYDTALFGKWGLGEDDPPDDWDDDDSWDDHLDDEHDYLLQPLAHGFSWFQGVLHGSLLQAGGGGSYYDWVALTGRACDSCSTGGMTVANQRWDYATVANTNDALAWINDRDQPWLAVVSYNAPHTPFELPPEGCSYREDGADVPVTDGGVHAEMTECMDRQIGVLLDGIDRLDNTVVIFMGDNGTDSHVLEAPYDDGGGKGSIAEGGVRVPLLLADGKQLVQRRDGWSPSRLWAGAPDRVATPGSTVAAPVHTTDLFATIADLAGADGSAGQDSVSLVPLVDGTAADTHVAVYTERFSPDLDGDAALRMGDWKLVESVQQSDDGPCRLPATLFQLHLDRFELIDRASVHADTVDALEDQLDLLAHDTWLDVPDC